MAFLANLNMKKDEQFPHFLAPYRHRRLRIGFSGGADSTALLLLLLKWHFDASLLEAVHFEHGLRGEVSCADAKWCEDFCKKLNVRFTLVELDLLNRYPGASSIEALARSERLAWYSKNPEIPVLLAHHADDAAENLLLKLARGGNVSTLSSLRYERKVNGVTLLRPLLDWRKHELEDFLRSCNIEDWRIDATNHSVDYHRNFVRNKLLAEWQNYYPPLDGALASSLQALACDADFIESCALEKFAGLGKPLPRKTGVEFWKNLHPALRTRVLRDYLSWISNNTALALNRTQIEHFNRVLERDFLPEKRCVDLGNGLNFVLQNGSLTFVGNTTSNDQAIQEWDYLLESNVEYGSWQLTSEILPGAVECGSHGEFFFDLARMPAKLYCSMRQGGEVMQVWGSEEPRRVKHLLCGADDKENMLIVAAENKEIYLLGDLRRNNKAPVLSGTENTLKITVKKCKN